MKTTIVPSAGRNLLPLLLVAPILTGCGDSTPKSASGAGKPDPLRAATPSGDAGATGLVLAARETTSPATNAAAVAAGSGAPISAGKAVAVSQLVEVAQLASLSNRLAEVQQAQAAVVDRLLSRIDALEKRESSQAAAAAASAQAAEAAKSAQAAQAVQVKASEEQAKQLVRQISELESRVLALKAEKPATPAPSARPESPSTQELAAQLRAVERQQQLAAAAQEARAKEAPIVTAGPSGFAISSANTNFVLKLRGLVQLDGRVFAQDNPLSDGNDTFALRRARPILEGSVYRDFEFQFVPDFGGNTVQIFDANLNYRLRPEIQLRAGKFKGPVGLEHLQSDATLPFNERGTVSNFMPTRNIGIALWGDVAGGLLSYSVGAYNVTGDGRNPANSDFSDEKEFAGRLFVQPFRQSGVTALQGFGVGLGGSYSQVNSNANGLPSTTGGIRPGYLTSGLQQFFAYNPASGSVVADGAQWRLSPQFSYVWGPFGLLGEYGISHQSVLNGGNSRSAGLNHTAWQLAAQWVLTGEKASFTGIVPSRPFSPAAGGWGAWQLVARYGELTLDDDTFPTFSNPALSAHSASAWALGVNWWLNRNVRLLTSFSHTSFEGGGGGNPLDASTRTAPATVTAQDENVFLARLQLAF